MPSSLSVSNRNSGCKDRDIGSLLSDLLKLRALRSNNYAAPERRSLHDDRMYNHYVTRAVVFFLHKCIQACTPRDIHGLTKWHALRDSISYRFLKNITILQIKAMLCLMLSIKKADSFNSGFTKVFFGGLNSQILLSPSLL